MLLILFNSYILMISFLYTISFPHNSIMLALLLPILIPCLVSIHYYFTTLFNDVNGLLTKSHTYVLNLIPLFTDYL